MAIKKTKTKTKQTRTAAPVDKARTFWLAGLGAVSIAQKRGGELLTRLIGEGKVLQARTQKLAQTFSSDAKTQVEGALAPLRVAANQNAEKVASAVQHGVAAVLAKFGIPSKSDIEELTQRVAALSAQCPDVGERMTVDDVALDDFARFGRQRRSFVVVVHAGRNRHANPAPDDGSELLL